MKRYFIPLILSLIIITPGWSQSERDKAAFEMLSQRGEIYFSFQLDEQSPFRGQLEKLTQLVSIDKVTGSTIVANANTKEFNRFLGLGLPYELLTTPSMLYQPKMAGVGEFRSLTDWNFYPTYFAYIDIMNQFADDYPDLCEVVNIGTLPSTRQLLMIHINDSLGVDQGEPEFLYTSSMHGDETSGYIISLHLIDYLLENYGTDDQVTNLVNNMDIWINPLANPDGTYAGGNNTVFGATRRNANGVDLNRNYPDPEDGPHPDGNSWQPETEAFMDFAGEHRIMMSANFHDGAEVANYPWDTWPRRAADDAWWIYVCRQFADTVQLYSPPGYFTDLNNGITNGYDWYTIDGGRQDYMNYFHHCREFTLEISGNKLLPESQLLAFFEYQHRSMLNYMEHALYGIHGTVTNAETGDPVAAKVFIENHDEDESHVYSHLPTGKYHRPIKQGIYDITFSSFGFYSQTIENVSPVDGETLTLNVALQPFENLNAVFEASDTLVEVDGMVDFTDVSEGDTIVSWTWAFEGGVPASSTEQHPSGIAYLDKGEFDVSLTVKDQNGRTSTLTCEDYIVVTDAFTMKDTTVYLCEGLFYDSGGQDNNYQDGETYTATFVSLLESGTLEVVFIDFDVEESTDCGHDFLEVYDGMNVEAPYIGTYCGSTIPGSFTAHNPDGALTFRFVSNESVNQQGWKAYITCDTSVGIMEAEADIMVLAPNPASHYCVIESPENISSIVVKDLSGKRLQQLYPDGNQQYISMEGYKKGLYLIQIESKGRIYNKKLVLR